MLTVNNSKILLQGKLVMYVLLSAKKESKLIFTGIILCHTKIVTASFMYVFLTSKKCYLFISFFFSGAKDSGRHTLWKITHQNPTKGGVAFSGFSARFPPTYGVVFKMS